MDEINAEAPHSSQPEIPEQAPVPHADYAEATAKIVELMESNTELTGLLDDAQNETRRERERGDRLADRLSVMGNERADLRRELITTREKHEQTRRRLTDTRQSLHRALVVSENLHAEVARLRRLPHVSATTAADMYGHGGNGPQQGTQRPVRGNVEDLTEHPGIPAEFFEMGGAQSIADALYAALFGGQSQPKAAEPFEIHEEYDSATGGTHVHIAPGYTVAIGPEGVCGDPDCWDCSRVDAARNAARIAASPANSWLTAAMVAALPAGTRVKMVAFDGATLNELSRFSFAMRNANASALVNEGLPTAGGQARFETLMQDYFKHQALFVRV